MESRFYRVKNQECDTGKLYSLFYTHTFKLAFFFVLDTSRTYLYLQYT